MPGNFYTVSEEEMARWPPPNYVNPEQRTWLPPYAIVWECITTLFVFGRLCLRLRNPTARLGSDDVLIFVAWVFSVASTTIACISIWRYDVGKHAWDVRPENYTGALYYAWLAQVMFIHSTGATKTSVLLFYRRMAATTYSAKWLYAVWLMLALVVAGWIAMFIAYCFMCTPLDTYWTIHDKMAAGDHNYTCLNGDAVNIIAGVLTILSDLWTAALPCAMFQVYDLGVSKRQKIALNVIFCLGFLVAGVGAARTYFLWKMGTDQDLSWHGYDLFVTTIIETQLAIILTCAPFLRALFRRYFSATSENRLSRKISCIVPHKHYAASPEPLEVHQAYAESRRLTWPDEVRSNRHSDSKKEKRVVFVDERIYEELPGLRESAYGLSSLPRH